MGDNPRIGIGRRRKWLSLSAGLCMIAALAACGSTPAPGKAGTPPTIGAAVTMDPAIVSIPPSATHAKRATPKPTPHSSKSATTGSPSTTTSSGTGGPGGGTSSAPPPAGSSGSAACVTSKAQFNCGPFHYPQIVGVSSNPTVGNNVWNPINGWQQTLYANNPGNWRIVANEPAGNTAIVSYPSSSANFNNKPLSSFRQLTSSFTETMNANSGTSAWSMYDIWLNNAGKVNEVMVQYDFARNGACGPDATMTFSGQEWYLCNFGGSVAIKLKGNESSGTVDLLAMLNWLKDHGYASSSAQVGSIGHGWEIASTGGRSETFTVSRYTITSS